MSRSTSGNVKGYLQPASCLLQSLLQNSKSPLSDQFLRWKLWRQWPELMGPEFSRHSEPVGYDRGKLIIWVDSSARMQEWTYVVGAIKDKINAHIGKEWVKFIRFTTDRKSVPRQREELNLDQLIDNP